MNITTEQEIHTTVRSRHPNELHIIERLILCPGSPYHSAWLAYYFKTLPEMATDTSSKQKSST